MSLFFFVFCNCRKTAKNLQLLGHSSSITLEFIFFPQSWQPEVNFLQVINKVFIHLSYSCHYFKQSRPKNRSCCFGNLKSLYILLGHYVEMLFQ